MYVNCTRGGPKLLVNCACSCTSADMCTHTHTHTLDYDVWLGLGSQPAVEWVQLSNFNKVLQVQRSGHCTMYTMAVMSGWDVKQWTERDREMEVRLEHDNTATHHIGYYPRGHLLCHTDRCIWKHAHTHTRTYMNTTHMHLMHVLTYVHAYLSQ